MYGLELVGEEDAFTTREAEATAMGVTVITPGLVTARDVKPERAGRLAYTRRAVKLIGRCTPGTKATRVVVVAANVDREGIVTVRARDMRGLIGTSATDVEHELGPALVDRSFSVDLDDPDRRLRICFSEGACLVGWTAVKVVRDFIDRKPTDQPFFQPGNMAPVDTRAFVNMADVEPGTRILDPMCGTGNALLEAGLVDANVVGTDAQMKMIGGAREDLYHYVSSGDMVRGGATTLPLCDDSMDGAMFDTPCDRQLEIACHSLMDPVGDVLAEAHRVTPECVVVTDQSRTKTVEDAGWEVRRVLE